MNINPGKTEFSEAEHTDLIFKVRAAQKVDGLSQAALASQADVPDSTLSQYLNNKYPNESGRSETASKLRRWLIARDEARKIRKRIPVPPAYLDLDGSEALIDILAYARETGDMVLETGMPGVCKTSAARQYAATTPRVWYAAMDSTTSGVPTMLLEILAAMGFPDAVGTPQKLIQRICAAAKNGKGLIIVDEAQALSMKAFEALRAINDRTQNAGMPLGIAVLGNEIAYGSVGPTGAKAAFAQVSSRFASRNFIKTPNPRDATRLASAWAETNGEVITEVELAFCREIATRPGGLRNIEKTMRRAIIAARGCDEPLGIEHLRSAFDTLSGAANAA